MKWKTQWILTWKVTLHACESVSLYISYVHDSSLNIMTEGKKKEREKSSKYAIPPSLCCCSYWHFDEQFINMIPQSSKIHHQSSASVHVPYFWFTFSHNAYHKSQYGFVLQLNWVKDYSVCVLRVGLACTPLLDLLFNQISNVFFINHYPSMVFMHAYAF